MPLSHPIAPPNPEPALAARDAVLFGHWIRDVEPTDEVVALRVAGILERIGVRCRPKRRKRRAPRGGFDSGAAWRALRALGGLFRA